MSWAEQMNNGYVLLNAELSFESQVRARNTVYEIRFDYDLHGNEVEIPSGCVLQFNGGAIKNGVLVLNNCSIDAAPYRIFSDNLILKGVFSASQYFPEWFGAVGDSRTDDSKAIQQLIDCGLPVHLSPKTYCIKTPLYVRDATSIIGVGFSSIIKAVGCNAITSKQSSRGVLLTNLRLLGDKSKNNSGILFESSMPKLVVDNLHISGFGFYGIYLKQAWDYSIRNVNVSENENGFYANAFNSSSLDKVVAFRNNGFGVVIVSSANAQITGTVQENGLTGLYLQACYACNVSVYGEQNGFNGRTNEETSEIVLTNGGGRNDDSCFNFVQFYLNGGAGTSMESKYGLYINKAIKNTIIGMSIRHISFDIFETDNSSDNILVDPVSNSNNRLTTKNSLSRPN